MQNLRNNHSDFLHKFHLIFEGNNQVCGIFKGRYPDGKKIAYEQKSPINFETHLKGKEIQGISPVRDNKAKWLCVDVDIKIEPKEICSKIFRKIGCKYFCFKTMSDHWRIVEIFNEWQELDFMKVRSKELEKKIEKIGFKCDSTHTLPHNPGWIYLPYHDCNTVCFSPSGYPLSLEQFEFRARYRENPLVVSAVGLHGKGIQGSRNKALFAIHLYTKHYPDSNILLDQVNKNFNSPMDEVEFHREIKSTFKSASSEKYDKQFLINAIPKWCEEMVGCKPYIEDNFIEEVVQPELIKGFVYCNQNLEFYDIKEDKFKTKEQLNDWWFHLNKGKPISKTLLADPSLVRVWSTLKHAGYPPGVIKVRPNEINGIPGGDYLNYYQPSTVEAKPGDHFKFVEYYKWLFESDDKIIYEDQEYSLFDVVMMFLAYHLVHPGKKILWAILIQSTPGSGKGLLAEIMASILGQSNVLTNVSFDRLVSDHSTLIAGKQLIVINELSLTGKRIEGKQLANKLKPYFTDAVHIINPKFKEEQLIPNLCNFFLYTNDLKPIHVEKNDRRILYIKIKYDKNEIQQKIKIYKNYLLQLCKDPSAVKYYLLNHVKLVNEEFFGEHAPFTRAKEELIEFSKDDFEATMDEAFKNHHFPFKDRGYHTKDSSNPFTQYTYRGYVVIEELLEVLNYDPVFKELYKDRFTLTQWIKNNSINWADGNKSKLITLPHTKERRRAWLLEDLKQFKGKNLSALSPSDVGKDFIKYKFRNPGIAKDYNTFEKDFTSGDLKKLNEDPKAKNFEETFF